MNTFTLIFCVVIAPAFWVFVLLAIWLGPERRDGESE